MNSRQDTKDAILKTGLLSGKGATVLMDGQFGSTGKGLLAAVIAEASEGRIDIVSSSAGPNSGHTSYFGDEKVILTQLPTAGVHLHKLGYNGTRIQMNAGSVLTPSKLIQEVRDHANWPAVAIHPAAAVVDDMDVEYEKKLVGLIGSTGKGTGAAMVRKILRHAGATAKHNLGLFALKKDYYPPRGKSVFVEVSQGHSLGINQGFYPFCTSRDCGVQQGLADAGVHPKDYRGSFMSLRTYPIRVAGNSGPVYPDQKELNWEDLGFEPELTTVTQKVRRIFTWSRAQFREAIEVNQPDVLFLNFCNYISGNPESYEIDSFVHNNLFLPYCSILGRRPSLILTGHGPRNADVRVWNAS
jgi:adenylosuccinate synthase